MLEEKEQLKLLCQNLLKYCEIKKISKEELEEKAGILQQDILKCSKGKPNITLETIFKLSELLEITPEQLLDFE